MSFKRLLFISIAFLSYSSIYAQLKVSAEIRPRFEYRHGFKTLFADGLTGANFISQRTRLNTQYSNKNLKLFISLQDVRVWGDVSQLNAADRNAPAIHQSWGEIVLNPNFSLKLGRQEIDYDDSRIFGNVAWAQQARSHDAALLKFKNNKLQIDLGIAYNQDGVALSGNTLINNGTYKAFQYLWLHKDWKHFSASILALNNGMQFIDTVIASNNETRYAQTLGTHLKYNKNKWAFFSNLYTQLGKDMANNSMSAYLLSAEANYKAKTWLAGIGGELISGNDNGTSANGENKAFNPVFGTNHKFNGWMDYFYVGNHINNVGLIDIYLKGGITIKEKSNLLAVVHNFAAPQNIAGTNSTQLGTEVDVVYSYKFNEYVGLKAGYSQMFAQEGMEFLKGVQDNNVNNWGWLMITIKPTIFETN